MGHHGEEVILSGGSAEVGVHGGVGGAVSGNDDVVGEPDGESGGDGGVGWLEQIIPLCPYVPPLKRPSAKKVTRMDWFIIARWGWRVWPFCYYASADDTGDKRSHGITPLHLPVSNIFNVTLQAI